MSLSPEQQLAKVAKQLAETSSVNASYTQQRRYLNPVREIEERGTICLRRPNLLHRMGSLRGVAIPEQLADGKVLWVLRSAASPPTYERQPINNVEISLESLAPLQGFFDPSVSHLRRVQTARREGRLIFLRDLGRDEAGQSRVAYAVRERVAGEWQRIERCLSIDGRYRVRKTEERVDTGTIQTETVTVLRDNPLPSAERFQVKLPPGAQPFVPPPAPLTVGTLAPAFSFSLLDAPTARPLTLEQLRGQVVILDFWATWCVPCLKGFPALQKLAATKPVTVLLVPRYDDPAAVARWYKENGANYPNLHVVAGGAEADAAGVAYHVSSIPQTYRIGEDGRIQASTLDTVGA